MRHQRQEAGGLEGDRFAACVRAGDQQDVELAAQVEADRHHGAGQQRMASLDQLEHGLAGRARQADKLRRSSALLLGQASRGTCKVDLRQALDAAEERLGLFAHLLAQRAQDALDFVLLVQDQRAPAIGHLDHGDRLDEQRGAAGRLIVDDAGHLPARLGADRNNVATVPLGDHRVLDHVAERWRGHDLAQARDQAIVGAAQLGPNATQGGAGGIQDLAAFGDGVLDVFYQARVVAQVGLGELEQRRGLVDQRAQATPPGARGAHCRRDVEQLFGAEGAADLGALGQWTDVVDSAEMQPGPEPGQLERLGRGRLTPFGLFQLRGWQQCQRQLAARRETRMPCQQLAHRIELERLDRERAAADLRHAERV